jgi:hypothetical protein
MKKTSINYKWISSTVNKKVSTSLYHGSCIKQGIDNAFRMVSHQTAKIADQQAQNPLQSQSLTRRFKLLHMVSTQVAPFAQNAIS